MHFDDEEFENCDGPYAGDGEGWDRQNSTGAGTFDLYSGTQNSVNTFFAQLETQTGHVRAPAAGRRHGRQGAACAEGAVVDPRRLRHRPAEMAQAYATFAARGLHCDPRPVTEVLDSRASRSRTSPSSASR